MRAKADLNLQNNVSTSTVQLIIVSAYDQGHKLGKHYDQLCAYIVCWHVTIHLQDGATALYIASVEGHVKTVKLLVEAGASLDVQKNVSWYQYISDNISHLVYKQQGDMSHNTLPQAIQGDIGIHEYMYSSWW